MKPQFVLGIDPGLQGALALLSVPDRKIQALYDMPCKDGQVDPAGVAVIVDMAKSMSGGSLVAAIEQVSGRPHQAGVWSFAFSTGLIHGVLGCLGVPAHLIQPAQWKNSTGLRRAVDESQTENKTRARLLASTLWPEWADSFRLVKWDGRAESALIGRFFITKNGWGDQK